MLRQAMIYRVGRDDFNLFVIQARFSSLLLDTIPKHADFKSTRMRYKDLNAPLCRAISELEALTKTLDKAQSPDRHEERRQETSGMATTTARLRTKTRTEWTARRTTPAAPTGVAAAPAPGLAAVAAGTTTSPAPTKVNMCREYDHPKKGAWSVDEDCCAGKEQTACEPGYRYVTDDTVCYEWNGCQAHHYSCVLCDEGEACDDDEELLLPLRATAEDAEKSAQKSWYAFLGLVGGFAAGCRNVALDARELSFPAALADASFVRWMRRGRGVRPAAS